MVAKKTGERETLVERAQKLRGDLAHTSPVLGAERFKYLMESYKETEGEPTILRRAKVFEKFLNEKTIYIDENPIVGTVSEHRAGVLPYPEYSCRWMKKETKHRVILGDIDAARLSEEEDRWRNEAVDYWQDKCQWAKVVDEYTQAYGENPTGIVKAGVGIQNAAGYPLGFVAIDYGKAVTKGMNAVIAEVEEKLADLPPGYYDSLKKRQFYNAVRICLNAVIDYAERYAALAGEMAQNEADPERRKELEKIANACRWVPANPPRNFYEAVQSFWFAHCAAEVEENTWGIVPGKFSQYTYPYYKKDKEEGRITEEEAVGILGMLFVKFQELSVVTADLAFLLNSAQMAQHISIGGYTSDGLDCTNEIDHLLLETQKIMKCAQPSLTLLYHNRLSEDFLLKAVDLIRTGIGQPQFMNLEVMIQRHLRKYPGLTMEEARDSLNVGCVGSEPWHKCSTGYETYVNMPKMLELALNNGKDPYTGGQVGPETGDIGSFQSYDELMEAIRKQTEYFMPRMRDIDRIGLAVLADMIPTPFKSAFLDDCLERGEDQMRGGTRYPASATFSLGIVDLANSLAAIKKLVFDNGKQITMKQLKEALDADFEGYEEIHRLCSDAPKYGNDDDYVDEITKECYALFWEEHQKVGGDWLGRHTIPENFTASAHNPGGKRVGALPSGRKAWIALTDASVSAQPGTDTSGPTALVRSATKVLDTIKWGSNHMNMKFHPSALEGKEGARKLLALIKTYMDLGGSHVQFNCVSADTLKDAQLNPEEYRDLVVRVAGFSAFFIHLDKGIQDEMIKRSEIKFEK